MAKPKEAWKVTNIVDNTLCMFLTKYGFPKRCGHPLVAIQKGVPPCKENICPIKES
jgi:hypothetical protein